MKEIINTFMYRIQNKNKINIHLKISKMKSLKIVLLASFVQFLSANVTVAEILKVPDQFQEIQDAIDFASDGDTVLVYPGEYQEQISFSGKDIVVGSLFIMTNDPEYIDSTKIMSIDNGYVVSFPNFETRNSKISGFTIEANGFSKAIYCTNSSPTIEHNIFILYRWGICCESGSCPLITNNVFDGNSMHACIWLEEGNAVIIGNNFIGVYDAIRVFTSENVKILNNHISGFLWGINGGNNGDITGNLIENCTVAVTNVGDGIRLINNTIVNNMWGLDTQYGNPDVINCVFWGNEINVTYTTACKFSHCCIQSGMPPFATDLGGNIFFDPIFSDPGSGDYTLACYSPCVESGTPDTTGFNLPSHDLLNNIRITDGNGDGSSVIDIGYYESYAITNQGYIQGTVTLIGGNGNVEDVLVGIGAMIHPGSEGQYILVVSPDGSPYDITANLDDYLPQTQANVPVTAGQTTSDINFELIAYEPDTILTICPDSILFLDENSVLYGRQVVIKNVSLFDVHVNYVFFGNYSWFFYTCPEVVAPEVLLPDDSLNFGVYPDGIIFENLLEIVEDTMFISTDRGIYSIPIKLDLDLVWGSIDEKTEGTTLLKAFPNPVKEGKVTFEFENTDHHRNMELRIYNIFGIEIKRQHVYRSQQTTEMDVTAWPAGIYLAVIFSNGGAVGRVKFVVE